MKAVQQLPLATRPRARTTTNDKPLSAPASPIKHSKDKLSPQPQPQQQPRQLSLSPSSHQPLTSNPSDTTPINSTDIDISPQTEDPLSTPHFIKQITLTRPSVAARGGMNGDQYNCNTSDNDIALTPNTPVYSMPVKPNTNKSQSQKLLSVDNLDTPNANNGGKNDGHENNDNDGLAEDEEVTKTPATEDNEEEYQKWYSNRARSLTPTTPGTTSWNGSLLNISIQTNLQRMSISNTQSM